MGPKTFLLVFLFATLVGCGQSESIDVKYAPKTIAEQKGEADGMTKLILKQKFSEVRVNRPLRFPIPIPIIGSFIQDFSNILANSIIFVNSGEWQVDKNAEPIYLEIPDIDEDFVKTIRVKKISISIVPDTAKPARNFIFRTWDRIRKNQADLKFVNDIKILVSHEDNLSDARKKDQVLTLASYKKGKQKLGCDGQCIEFEIQGNELLSNQLNLVPFLKGRSGVYVSPLASVSKTPKWNFEIQGEIEFEVELRLGF